ncbi:MAG: hypothetical protein IT367_09740 [Candidatus Hydrogenedentes bacterium]|nr:hypothetical protein [Candidatus Hydrogenedentota bacterium]
MNTLALAALLAALSQAFQAPSPNIAKGAPYTLQPAPNYTYCTEAGDATQLTDGIFTTEHFWTQPSTVGWQNSRPVVIVIDLGADKPIRGVSYTTAAGVAGVYWPGSIQLFAGDDAKHFHWLGDLVTLSARKGAAPLGEYALHRFWTDELKSHGRYLALAVLAEPFTFVDEIEVYEGDSAWTSSAMPGEAIDDVVAFTTRLSMRVAVQRRLQQDIDAVRSRAAGANESVRTAVLAELDSVQNALADLPADFPADFKAILPLNDIHARVFRAQAQLWIATGATPLNVWDANAQPIWNFRTPYDAPKTDDSPMLRIDMMQNEFRSGAFYLGNAAQEDIDVTLRFSGLPGGGAPSYITVHEATWTDTRMGVPVEAALPLAPRNGDAYTIRVHSGLSRQVWLTVHSKGIEAGKYAGAIQLESSLGAREVPMELTVYPIQFPDKPRLHCGGWDYTDQPAMYGVTAENRESLIAYLKDHFVDSPWGTSQVLPYGSFDADGKMTAPPDTKHFDEWVARWDGAAQYCVFAAVGEHLASMATGSAPFERAAKEWFNFWADHIRASGLKPEQFAVLLVDEPYEHQHDAAIAAWAKPLREANTGIRLWIDPTHRTMAVTEAQSIAVCDAVCPNRQIFYQAEQPYRDFFTSLPGKGKQLEFYSCSGPVRVLDPYSYHRLQPWDCWRYGAKASYFWAFGDTGGGSAWNEYAAKGTCYTPLFLDATSVTTGKHMEAIREGIEDYEYLAMLDEAVAAAKDKNVDAAILESARALLNDGPASITDACFNNKGFDWDETMDRGAADGVRVKILELLTNLQTAGSKS